MINKNASKCNPDLHMRTQNKEHPLAQESRAKVEATRHIFAGISCSGVVQIPDDGAKFSQYEFSMGFLLGSAITLAGTAAASAILFLVIL